MKTILLVDDKLENLYLLESLLASNGYTTISSKNGAEALSLIRSTIPDLIISDILMPVMDGFTLCKECKKDVALKDIPFFFYTATYVDPKDEEYALGLGADRFIIKPQEPDVFLEIVNTFLEEAKKKGVTPKEITKQSEAIVLKEYNEVLIRKIEDKMLQTEKAEKELRRYSEELEKEIEEKKRKEIELKQSQQLFQTLAQVSPVGIFRTSSEGKINYVNPRWSELSGLNLEEAEEDQWLNAVHPDDLELVKNNWESSVLSQKSSETEFRFVRKDRSVVWVIKNAVPEWIDDTFNGYIGTITDITAIKKYEDELVQSKEKAEESDRLKSAFLHNISHEVRTPLNAIMGFSSLLGKPGLEKDKQLSYIKTIQRGGEQLLLIMNDILDISTIEAKIAKIHKRESDVNSILRQLRTQFSLKASTKNLDLNIEKSLPDKDAIVLTDKTKLTQIISNLLHNAIKFTDQGQISMGCKIKDSFLEFYVSDTGIGIPSDAHEKIFNSFYQVDNTLTRLYEGTGLGLSISKAYVELLGGKIRVESQKGKGSVFSFTIPYESVKSEYTEEHVSSGNDETIFEKQITILVAEDDEISFELISRLLAKSNVDIIHAVNGQEAIEICQTNKNIDVALMDIRMPKVDGYEATRRIREFNHHLPIIAQTAFIRDKERTLDAGCNDFISKPYNTQELVAIIKKNLQFGTMGHPDSNSQE